MKDIVSCYKCGELFEVEYEDYYDVESEDTFTVIKCPYCLSPNSIYYSTSVDYHATEPTEEDRKNFKSDIEDAEYIGMTYKRPLQ